MAVKWAIANGNWIDGTTWNDGIVPTIDDDVYLNGFVVAMPNSSTYISVKSINNGETPTTGNFGGYLSGGYRSGSVSYLYLNADIHVSTASYFWNDGSRSNVLYINGNITVDESAQLLPNHANYGNLIYCTGNINALGILIGASSSHRLHCVGNVTAKASSFAPSPINDVNIVGGVNVSEGAVSVGTLTINGSITYESTNNSVGVRYTTLNILNPDTFTWKDVTEPRSNPFIILTDAEMNNRQQYPSENEVKEGTEYVWGEKVGTYQQPPESVVLKGYEYDTITAEENDIATYNLTRYIYADYGTLHWFELKTTTTDIVTTPSQQSITIGGETVVADTDYVVEYNDVCYQWSGSAWGNITTKNIGTVKTDILTNPTETTLCVKKGTLETSNISQQLISRLENCATVETVQQLLVAHLDN